MGVAVEGVVKNRCHKGRSRHGVELAADAYLSCLTHALSAAEREEREEVMGLLLGEVRKHLQLISNDNSVIGSIQNV